MEKVTKYVVVRFYKPAENVIGAYNSFNFHIYSRKSGNKAAIVAYAKELMRKQQYNYSGYQWRVMTEEAAHKKQREYLAWCKQNEKILFEKKWPSRYVGQTRHEELAEMMTNR